LDRLVGLGRFLLDVDDVRILEVAAVKPAVEPVFEITKGVLVSERPGLVLVVVIFGGSCFSLVTLEIDDERTLDVESTEGTLDAESTEGTLVSDLPDLALFTILLRNLVAFTAVADSVSLGPFDVEALPPNDTESSSEGFVGNGRM